MNGTCGSSVKCEFRGGSEWTIEENPVTFDKRTVRLTHCWDPNSGLWWISPSSTTRLAFVLILGVFTLRTIFYNQAERLVLVVARTNFAFFGGRSRGRSGRRRQSRTRTARTSFAFLIEAPNHQKWSNLIPNTDEAHRIITSVSTERFGYSS